MPKIEHPLIALCEVNHQTLPQSRLFCGMLPHRLCSRNGRKGQRENKRSN